MLLAGQVMISYIEPTTLTNQDEHIIFYTNT